MIAVTIQTKIHFIVLKEHVHKTVSDVQTIDVFRPLGIVMETMVRIEIKDYSENEILKYCCIFNRLW